MGQLTGITKALSTMASLERAALSHLLSVSDKVKEIRAEELKRMPLHINVIAIAAAGRLKETAHSAILQQLLKHQAILESFLQSIAGLESPRVTADQVREPDKDRMDVSIYGDDQCYIVENKVNDASEQEGQVFRYVQLALQRGYAPEQIKVIYLNSIHNDPPTDYSLTENGEGKNRIPPEVEDSMMVKDYRHDIYQWVKDLPAIIPPTEQYLHCALAQYQDYLEEYFNITDKFEPMNKRIRQTIDLEILKGISDEEDIDFSKRLAMLEEASADLGELLKGVDVIIRELRIRKETCAIQKELDKDGLSLIDLTEYGYNQTNYGVRMSINGKRGFIVYGYGGKWYIGFAFKADRLTDSEKECLVSLFNQLGKENRGEEKRYPCWDYVDNAPLLDEYVRLVRSVKAQTAADNGDNCIQIEC